jgi:hypothetical protein
MRYLICLSAAAALASCASPSHRIADELVRYGLDPARSQCIGQRLERELTTAQLRELAATARAYAEQETTPGRLTASDLMRVARSVRDPAVPVTVVRVASGCGVTIADVLGMTERPKLR